VTLTHSSRKVSRFSDTSLLSTLNEPPNSDLSLSPESQFRFLSWYACIDIYVLQIDRLCGLVVRVLGYRSGGRVRFPALPEKKIVGLERGSLSLVSTTEELLDRKVAPPV
jgi:hypothetical protein